MNKEHKYEHELFHIIHSKIWKINESRTKDNKIVILDSDIYEMVSKIINLNK